MKHRLVQCLLAASALFVLAGCGACGGTNGGNPGCTAYTEPPPVTSDSPPDAQGPTTAAEALLNTVCGRLTACAPTLTTSACVKGIGAATNIDQELGLQAGQYTDIAAVISAESAGTLKPNLTASEACRAGVAAVSCSTIQTRGIYLPSMPSNFSNVYKIFPQTAGSCPDVY